jgi:membrane protein YqaA with SNARE-associated domain
MTPDKSLPISSDATVHRLQGRSLQVWWHNPLILKKNDRTNPLMCVWLQQLAVIPFIPLFYPAVSQNPERLFGIAAYWLGCFALLLVAFRKHRYNVLQVQTSKTGLLLQSPFLIRTLSWSEISDFFAAGTVDSKDYVLQCKNGDRFFLSKELTDDDTLVEVIERNLTRKGPVYEHNYWIPDGNRDAARFCLVVVTVGVVLFAGAIFTHHMLIKTAGDFVGMAIMGALCLFGAAFGWLMGFKMPQQIRINQSGLCVGTGSRVTQLQWNEIREIRQLGGWLVIVRLENSWFPVFTAKREPVSAKLLELKRNLPRTVSTPWAS